jgi:hypothetical protein
LPLFVRASAGLIVPSEVVNVTTVPFWTAVPELSVTVATISTDPFVGTDAPAAKSAIVDSVGAVSGTLSHAARAAAIHTTTAARRPSRAVECPGPRVIIPKKA